MNIGYLPFYYGLIPLAVVLLLIGRERKRREGFTAAQKRTAVRSALFVPLTVLGVASLLNLTYAQEIKAQQLALNRATSVTRSIEVMQHTNLENSRSELFAGRWADPDIADLARSGEISLLVKKANDLSHGRVLSFSSEHGKDVKVKLVANKDDPSLFDAKILIDGRSVDDASLHGVQSVIRGEQGNGSEWINDYPTFVDSRFSVEEK